MADVAEDEDLALETARLLVDHCICECGDLDAEHATGAPPRECGECDCLDFQPVAFHVVRA